LCLATIYIGAVRTHRYGHDIVHLLDGGWRVLNGQRPHVDFVSPAGPVTYLVMAAGLELSGLRVEGVGYGLALFAAVVGLWAYCLLSCRLRFVPAALASLLVLLLACAPTPLGLGRGSLSHAMVYNRFGFALLALVLIEVLEEPVLARRRASADVLSGLSTGFACLVLLFLKASYFMVAAALVVAYAVISPRPRRSWLGLAVGAGAALFLFGCYLRWSFAAFLADQAQAGAVRMVRLKLMDVLFHAWRNQWNFLLMLLIAGLVTRWCSAETSGGGLSGLKWFLAVLAVYAAGILLMLTNAQEAGLPLSSVLTLLMVSSLGPGSDDQAAPFLNGLPSSQAVCLLVGLLFVVGSSALDAASVLQAVRERSQPPTRATLPFSSKHMAGLVLYDLPDPEDRHANSNGTRYVATVNDGIRLLKERSSPTESVMTLDVMNPFSYALLRRPARGGYSFLGYGTEFNDTHKPQAQVLFDEADIVMVPKQYIDSPEGHEGFIRNYLPGLQLRFSLAAESPCWWMYRHNR
jgi:hypothetical protein